MSLVRRKKKTCLIICESKADEHFLTFLKDRYRNHDWRFTIENVGGSGDTVFCRAKKSKGYSRIYCIIDACKDVDVQWPRGTTGIILKPGIEALPLQLLGKACPSNMVLAKNKFKAVFGSEAAKISKFKWQSKFTKLMLENKREDLEHLDEIINIFEQV
ncbi:hypothetical protein PQO03_12685 [Lentisphaera profundi]|uniref:DUF4276 family protein n=1 Tax=Lentisphaera profundi TaxID=1658616 RepID=A0ABY7VZK8_9BACT|nr:hypothetical protein [Lentisphaera profundi]WDE98693.1 hypothetical protein PQO03_12685 [Lentisphaera profundi]